MKKGGWRSSLFVQMIGLVVAVTIIPIGLLGLQMIALNERELENSLLEYHTQVASAAATQVSTTLARTMDNLTRIGQVLVVSKGMTRSEMQDLFLFFTGSDETISSLAYLDRAGSVVLTVGSGEGGIGFPDLAPFLAEARAAGSGGWLIGQAIPHVAGGVMLLPAAVKIVDRATGEPSGTVGALINLSRLQKVIEGVSLRRGGRAFLVDRDGRLLAHPDSSRALRRVDLKGLEIVEQFVKAGGATGGTVPFTDEEGRGMLGAYEPVPQFGWGVIVSQPKREAYASISRMKRQTLLFVALACIVAATVGGVYASQLSRPLRDFTAGALAIAKGDFRAQINVRTKNEIGQLAQTFNYMVQQLEINDQNMRELLLGSLKTLAAAIDAKDPYTRGHSERVTRFSMAIAREMGFKGKDLDAINIAALLHDVGKIGIEDSILRKPGLLTKEEYAVIKRHPAIGGEIMGAIKQLRDVVPGIRHHHEAFDGSGYPDGLVGQAIPLPARIIAIADSYDAMTSERPYQKAMTDDYVMTIIAKMAGERYDPNVVKAFNAAFAKGMVLRHLAEEAS
jgi:putative nucleotidyltransferase with HDIG domain